MAMFITFCLWKGESEASLRWPPDAILESQFWQYKASVELCWELGNICHCGPEIDTVNGAYVVKKKVQVMCASLLAYIIHAGTKTALLISAEVYFEVYFTM